MKKIITIVCLFYVVLCHSQKFELNLVKEYDWAKWVYTSIEFNNDCTILNGYVTGEDPFYTCFNIEECLECNGEKYKLLERIIIDKKYSKSYHCVSNDIDVEYNDECYECMPRKNIHFSQKFAPIFEIDSFFILNDWSSMDTIRNIHIRKILSKAEKIDNLKEYLDKIKKFEYGEFSHYQLRYVNQYLKNLKDIDGDSWKDSLLVYFNPIKSLMSKPLYSRTSGFLRQNTDYLKPILSQLKIDSKYKEDIDKVYKICDLLDSIEIYKEREIPGYEKFYTEGNELLDSIEGGLYYKNCFANDTTPIFQTNDDIYIIAEFYDTMSIFNNKREDYDSILKIKTHWRMVDNNFFKGQKNEIQYKNILLDYFEHKYGKCSYYYLAILMLTANEDTDQRKYEEALQKYEYIEHQLIRNKRKIKREQKSTFKFLGDLKRDNDDLYVLWSRASMKRSICYMKKGYIEKARKISPSSPFFMLRPSDSLELIEHCRSVIEELKEEFSKGLSDNNHLFDVDLCLKIYSKVFDDFTYYAIKTKNSSIIKYTVEEWLNSCDIELYREKKIKSELRNHNNHLLNNLLDSLLFWERKSDYYYTNNINNIETINTVNKIRDIQKNIIQRIKNGEIRCSEWVEVEDISKQLNDSSIAIIVDDMSLFETDTTMYFAISIDNQKHVDIKQLCEKQLLDSIGNTLINGIYSLDPDYNKMLLEKIYSCFWNPITDWISEKKNIYFSLRGSVALFPVESAILSHNNFYKNKNYYRLTSLLELLEKYPEFPKRAALYGGFDYLNTNECIEDSNTIDINDMAIAQLKSLKGSLGDITYESQKEVEQISQILNSSGIPFELFTKIKGTEKNIKSLSGSDVTNLHISTHGFYLSDSTDMTKDRSFLRPRKSGLSINDVNLKKSGLLMSGSLKSYYNSLSQVVEEDDILTAKDISLLDFSKIDLVVLSACETGVGDIIASNVYGLQRGFKKAGAKSVLMTLWEVEDEATTLFMVEYYKNLFQLKKSKYESLTSAQKYLKEYIDENGEKKYESPNYWAAFILLDGFD